MKINKSKNKTVIEQENHFVRSATQYKPKNLTQKFLLEVFSSLNDMTFFRKIAELVLKA